MPQILAGITASADKACVVVLSEESQAFELQHHHVFKVQTGGRPDAYRKLQGELEDFLKGKKVEHVYIQSSSGNKFGATLGLLKGAELRGVALAASAKCCDVTEVHKGSVSRTFGERNVDDYVKDDNYWDKYDLTEIPKGLRPAAFVILCSVLK